MPRVTRDRPYDRVVARYGDDLRALDIDAAGKTNPARPGRCELPFRSLEELPR
jgi:hypothetical protein